MFDANAMWQEIHQATQAQTAAQAKAKFCSNCSMEFVKSQRRNSYRSKINKQKYTVQEAVEGVISFVNNPMSPLSAESDNRSGPPVLNDHDGRWLCNDCVHVMGKIYFFVLEFKSRAKTGSYLHNKFTSIKQTPETPAMIPPPKTEPVDKKADSVQAVVDKIYKNPKSALAFRNCIRKYVCQEMTALIKSPLFVKESDDWINCVLADQEIDKELVKKAPLIHKMLLGMLSRNRRKTTFVKSMRIAIGIALRSRTRQFGVLQKYVGLTLYSGRARKPVFDTLSNLGLSCSHKTAERMLVEKVCNGLPNVSKEQKLEKLKPLLTKWKNILNSGVTNKKKPQDEIDDGNDEDSETDQVPNKEDPASDKELDHAHQFPDNDDPKTDYKVDHPNQVLPCDNQEETEICIQHAPNNDENMSDADPCKNVDPLETVDEDMPEADSCKSLDPLNIVRVKYDPDGTTGNVPDSSSYCPPAKKSKKST